MPSISDARRAYSPTPSASASALTAGATNLAGAIVGVGANLLSLAGSRSDPPTPTPTQQRPSISSPTPTLALLPQMDGMDPQLQLEELQRELDKQRKIKDGAENLLHVVSSTTTSTAGNKHLQSVERELSSARERIQLLTRAISQLKGAERVPGARRGTSASEPGKSKRAQLQGEIEDFKSALQSARACVAQLAELGRAAGPGQGAGPGPGPGVGVGQGEHTRLAYLARLTEVLQRNVRVRYELEVGEFALAVMPCLSDSGSKDLRTSAYRLIRFALVDTAGLGVLQEEGLDWYMIKTLSRDNKHVEETEQALKLLRAFLSLRSDPPASTSSTTTSSSSAPPAGQSVPISESLMRAFVALAESSEDLLHLAALETLAELVLVDIDLVCLTGGMRVLLQAWAEGGAEIGPALAGVFLYLIDRPRTRGYFRLGCDLESVFSVFSEVYGTRQSLNILRLRACSKTISSMLRSWSGLLYFSLSDRRAIASLVNTLRIPIPESREVLIDFFFELMRIRPPKWHGEFLQGKRLTLYGRAPLLPSKQPPPPPETLSPKLSLADQFVALLVSIFIEAGLLDALAVVVQEKGGDEAVVRRAALLLDEILQIVSRVLPGRVSSAILSLPALFAMATSFKDGDRRNTGINSLSSLDSLDRNRLRLQAQPQTNRNRSNSVDDAVRRGQRQAEQTRKTMAAAVDDKTFAAMILDTQVTTSRDSGKWNADLLLEVMDGALSSSKRLEEVLKTSKFCRRLLPFYHPFAHRFSDLRRTKPNEQRWVRLGCRFLRVLMSHPEGQRMLAEDKFLLELMECFAQLDPFNGAPASDPIFSKKRVEETLTYGYFEMLGTLSQCQEGIELLQRFRIFTAFYHLSELKSREDLIKGMIEHLDYSRDGHPRIVLSKALTSSYKHIRMYATEHLGKLVQASEEPHEWTLRLLLTQLYDPAVEVCEQAVYYLQEACQSSEVLQMVVRMRPTLEHLGELGHPLLLRFMSNQAGFRYLREARYVDREMDGWFQERNLQYVIQVEAFLAKALGQDGTEEFMDPDFDGIAPPHFYGEMAKTELGCQIIHEKGHFAEFAQVIRQHGLEDEDRELIAKLKSVLWAVGNIGSHHHGFQFIEEEDILQNIIDIAEQSAVLSVRGTAYFVLGLLSCTSEGAEILYEYGWEATKTPLGEPTGICLPIAQGEKMERFLDIPLWEPPPRIYLEPRMLRPPTTPLEKDVLLAIANLGNSMTANTASRTLARLKTRHHRLFSSITLLYRVLHLISTHSYRFSVRKYVLDLFEVRLDPKTIAALRKAAASLQEITPPPANVPAAKPRDSLRARGRTRSISDDEEIVSLEGEPGEEEEEEGPPRERLEAKIKVSGFGGDAPDEA
ncbi:hypothetical protein CALVIDRAFT_480721 [Calocera viscosa TUFC12733]|uniref:REM-1 domain-containing protein n=1 Tax=Calocera viscosa (strain TUFC12733) TaxID=1330018 RepID=A0A167MR64_CALVF|nr:hypothetical protein CALVIDRAFT_480721 [Calocera viscosa TUFC12733]